MKTPHNKNFSFPLKSRISAGSAILLVAGFLLLFGLPNPALATVIFSQTNFSTQLSGNGTGGAYTVIDGSSDVGSHNLGSITIKYNMNGCSGTGEYALNFNNGQGQQWYPYNSTGGGGTDITTVACDGTSNTYTKTFYFNISGGYGTPSVTNGVPMPNTCGAPFTGSGLWCPYQFNFFENINGGNDIKVLGVSTSIPYYVFDTDYAPAPADGFVTQDTPVDGQNNYTTITFTGTYADASARFERIFVTFNDVYPVVSATSFTKLYTIPAQSGVSIPYSFTETFQAGHTYEYQMLLAEADGSGQTSLTTAQSFGTSSSVQIDGITIAGSGTVNSGTINQLAYYDATGTAVSGNANVTVSSAALRLGVSGSALGTLLLSGNTSGTVTLASQAAAGTPTVTFGTSSGTPAVTASAPLAISSSTGNISITGVAGQVLAGATPAFTATPTLGASGTLGSITMGNATSGTITLQPTTGALGTVTNSLPAITATLTANIASGTAALGTSAISSATCATVVTVSATGTATTDVVTASFNGDPTAVTGYVPLTTGMLTIIAYPTSNNVNFKVCNNTGSSITPGAITLNWKVTR